jgi:hypothetical protein
MGKSCDFEKLAHGCAIMSNQTRQCLIDIGITASFGLECSRALFDAKAAQELRLLYWSKSGHSHRFDRPR